MILCQQFPATTSRELCSRLQTEPKRTRAKAKALSTHGKRQSLSFALIEPKKRSVISSERAQTSVAHKLYIYQDKR